MTLTYVYAVSPASGSAFGPSAGAAFGASGKSYSPNAAGIITGVAASDALLMTGVGANLQLVLATGTTADRPSANTNPAIAGGLQLQSAAGSRVAVLRFDIIENGVLCWDHAQHHRLRRSSRQPRLAVIRRIRGNYGCNVCIKNLLIRKAQCHAVRQHQIASVIWCNAPPP